MQKINLVGYINVDNKTPQEVHSTMINIENHLKIKDDGFLLYWLPIKGEQSRLEFTNSKIVDEFEYKSIKEIFDVYKRRFDEFLKK